MKGERKRERERKKDYNITLEQSLICDFTSSQIYRTVENFVDQ